MKIPIPFLFVLLATLISACSSSPEPKELETVTVQLKFVHQAQFAGMYLAIDHGYYEDEGIVIEFVEGGRGIDLISPVVNRRAQFGIAASDLILARRAEQNPIVAVAAIYRRCAAAFLTRKNSGIIRPEDMLGKRVAVLSKNAKEYEFQFRAMMKKRQLDISETELVPLDHQYEEFLAGNVEVTGAYITGGAMRLKRKGQELNIIWPGDYGIHFYSDTIFVHEDTIRHNPQLVERFLRATIKGWEHAIGNPEDGVAATMNYAKIQDKKLQTAMMDAQYPLIHTGENSIGWMKREVWQGMNEVLYQEKIIAAPLKDVSEVYTTTFLEAIKDTAQ